MHDSPALRASDDDRDRVIALLRDSAADGRLTLEELTQRMETAWSAVTLEQLHGVTADLARTPAEDPTVLAPEAPDGPAVRKPTAWLIAVMGGSSRKGRWRVGRHVNALAVMGGVDIDLREAVLEAGDEVTITAIAVMGAVDIVVPEGVEVELNGFVLMGGKDADVRGTLRPGAPLVRVRAFGLMGGISARTPKRRRRSRPTDDD